MRILTAICLLALGSSLAFAQCGNKCSPGDRKAGCCPAAAMTSYTDARLTPDCAPQPVHDFHRVLMPFIEAHNNREPSWIRDHAKALFLAAKPVPKSKACCPSFQKRAFKSSAKDLVKACDQLQKLSTDKAIADDAVMTQMKLVEDDFTALSNSCQ